MLLVIFKFMEKYKNLFSVSFLVIGFFIGWLVSGGSIHDKDMMNQGSHRMPNGEIMMDDSMQMSGMMDDMTSGLSGKIGDEFDQAFLDEMIVHHQGAIDMAKMVLVASKRPELIQLANDIITAQTKEIQMMSAWKELWF